MALYRCHLQAKASVLEETSAEKTQNGRSAKAVDDTELTDVPTTLETSLEESSVEESGLEERSASSADEIEELSLWTMPMTTSAEADVSMFDQERKAPIDSAIDGLGAKIYELEKELDLGCLSRCAGYDAPLLAHSHGDLLAAGSEGAAARFDLTAADIERFDLTAADSVDEGDLEVSYAELTSPWCQGNGTCPGLVFAMRGVWVRSIARGERGGLGMKAFYQQNHISEATDQLSMNNHILNEKSYCQSK